jgi:hypothetical protein
VALTVMTRANALADNSIRAAIDASALPVNQT